MTIAIQLADLDAQVTARFPGDLTTLRIFLDELVRVLGKVDRIEARSPTPIVRRALEAASLGPGVVLSES